LTWLTNLSIEECFTSDKHKLVCEVHFETYEFITQSLFANIRFGGWSDKSSRALSFSRGQENKISFCHILFELSNRTPDKPYRHWMRTLVCHACFGAWWYLDVTWYLVLRCYQNDDFQLSLTEF
jgi:hypothetical protein